MTLKEIIDGLDESRHLSIAKGQDRIIFSICRINEGEEDISDLISHWTKTIPLFEIELMDDPDDLLSTTVHDLIEQSKNEPPKNTRLRSYE